MRKEGEAAPSQLKGAGWRRGSRNTRYTGVAPLGCHCFGNERFHSRSEAEPTFRPEGREDA
jgi:hypothetical protein